MHFELHLVLEFLPADVARIRIGNFDFSMLGGGRVDLFQVQLQVSLPVKDLMAFLASYYLSYGAPLHGSTPRVI